MSLKLSESNLVARRADNFVLFKKYLRNFYFPKLNFPGIWLNYSELHFSKFWVYSVFQNQKSTSDASPVRQIFISTMEYTYNIIIWHVSVLFSLSHSFYSILSLARSLPLYVILLVLLSSFSQDLVHHSFKIRWMFFGQGRFSRGEKTAPSIHSTIFFPLLNLKRWENPAAVQNPTDIPLPGMLSPLPPQVFFSAEKCHYFSPVSRPRKANVRILFIRQNWKWFLPIHSKKSPNKNMKRKMQWRYSRRKKRLDYP